MPHGSVVHFEIPADNVARAQKFYEKTFGWRMQPMPEMNYTMVGTAPSDSQGMPTQPGTINGGMGARKAPLSHPVITISVDDIEAALAKVHANGGSTVVPKTPIGPMGFTAYFKDSEGNVVGLWQVANP
jgi:uncharacterized protein